MKISKNFLLTISILILFFVASSYLLFFKNLKFSINIKNFLQIEEEVEEIEKEIVSEKTKESTENNESSRIYNESYQIDRTRESFESEKESYIKPLTLKIIDICSGKLIEVFSISEGTRKCLNAPSPYNVLIEKNSTHILASILNENGFNETFEINDTLLIYFLFAEDVSTISKEIDSIYLEGSEYFFLGDYELQTIWERDSSGNLHVSKMIVVLPLYVKSQVEAGEYNINLFLETLGKVFYLGKLEISVK